MNCKSSVSSRQLSSSPLIQTCYRPSVASFPCINTVLGLLVSLKWRSHVRTFARSPKQASPRRIPHPHPHTCLLRNLMPSIFGPVIPALWRECLIVALATWATTLLTAANTVCRKLRMGGWEDGRMLEAGRILKTLVEGPDRVFPCCHIRHSSQLWKAYRHVMSKYSCQDELIALNWRGTIIIENYLAQSPVR